MKTLALILLLSSCLFAKEEDIEKVKLPEIKGYTWERIKEIQGAFLRPKGWFFKKTNKKNTLGIFISKENIDKKGQFDTGLTINVNYKINESQSMLPTEFAFLYRESARKSKELKKEWTNQMGPFKAVGFLYDLKDKTGEFTIHNLCIANDKTGTLYMVIFEAPKKEWAEAWKLGEPMLKYLYINDSI